MREYTPTWRGFDTFHGSSGNTDDYWYHLNGDRCPNVAAKVVAYDQVNATSPALGGTFRMDGGANGTYDTRFLSQKAVEIVEGHPAEKPLYLYFASHAVHVAMNAPLQTVERFAHVDSDARKVTNAMLLELDWAVGNLSAALARRSMLDNTVWIAHTDNGAPFSHGTNYPHRGAK